MQSTGSAEFVRNPYRVVDESFAHASGRDENWVHTVSERFAEALSAPGAIEQVRTICLVLLARRLRPSRTL
jgi:hypothetical protein